MKASWEHNIVEIKECLKTLESSDLESYNGIMQAVIVVEKITGHADYLRKLVNEAKHALDRKSLNATKIGSDL